VPAPTPPTNKGQKFPPEPLTSDEVRRLLTAASNRSSSGIRVRALIAVMYGAGLRIAETIDLYPRDADTEDGTVRVRCGKNSKWRFVGLDPFACGLLDRWLTRRSDLGLNGRHPIFTTYSEGNMGTPLSQRYIRTALARLATRSGIEKRVHPHGLRHSFAFDLAQRGTPIHQIQAQLGHESLSGTERYISHLAPMDVVAMMRERDWSAS